MTQVIRQPFRRGLERKDLEISEGERVSHVPRWGCGVARRVGLPCSHSCPAEPLDHYSVMFPAVTQSGSVLCLFAITLPSGGFLSPWSFLLHLFHGVWMVNDFKKIIHHLLFWALQGKGSCLCASSPAPQPPVRMRVSFLSIFRNQIICLDFSFLSSGLWANIWSKTLHPTNHNLI